MAEAVVDEVVLGVDEVSLDLHVHTTSDRVISD